MVFDGAANRRESIASIAIVAMEGRFPGAGDLETFWQNIASGKCSIRRLTEEELVAAGVGESALRDPRHVRLGAPLEGIDRFDAALFGLTTRQTRILDPQHRLFLECAWVVLESAGYAAEGVGGRVGVFAGSGPPRYVRNSLPTGFPFPRPVGALDVLGGEEGDSPASTVSSRLGLKGPSIAVQATCATSLVAVHLACQSLLSRECDLALAGATAVALPQDCGYLYEEGGILSPDGSCRSFDAGANGCVMGNGVGIVALRRLEDAIRDGDQVHAVVRGSAVNHQGLNEADRAKPDAEGQSEVIRQAMERAGVDAETIQYVEGHGTGVPAWDTAELAALNKVFEKAPSGDRRPLGSLKPNIGHSGRASGIAGLIKTVLALKHGQLPPTLQHQRPNRELESEGSRFCVNTTLSPWPATSEPRRAGVSSFGLGGTNAHVVLEEAPPREASGPSRRSHLLVLSANTASALEQATERLAHHIEANSDVNLADTAFTLQVGRRGLAHRRFAVCREACEAVELLETKKPGRLWTAKQTQPNRPVAFLFPGVGGQYAGMGRGLYESESTFRASVDRCAELLKSPLGQDIREVLYSSSQGHGRPEQQSPGWDLRAMLARRGSAEEVPDALRRTSLAHSCLFVVEYALARLLGEWGIRPDALIGHSLGEYTAACVAGVFSLEDGLRLLVQRAKRIESLPPGAMWGVALSEEEVRPFLDDELEVAAVNSPQAVVVSGSLSAAARLEERLSREQVAFRRLPVTHAFHSSMIAGASGELTELFAAVDLKAPSIPLVSCERGHWITAEEVANPHYWASQMCHQVRFEQGLRCLLESGDHFLLEVGPGESLASLAKQHPACGRNRIGLIQGTMRSVHEQCDDVAFLLNAVGHLWLAGITPDWKGFHAGQRRHRISLPTYPFERKRYWVDPVGEGRGEDPRRAGLPPQLEAESASVGEQPDVPRELADWFFVRCWRETPPARPIDSAHSDRPRGCCLVLLEGSGLGTELGRALRDAGHDVVFVSPGGDFQQLGVDSFTVRPDNRTDYVRLLQAVKDGGSPVSKVVHLWSLDRSRHPAEDLSEALSSRVRIGFYSLLALVQVLGDVEFEGCDVVAVTNGLHDVTGAERLDPADATMLGPCRVVRQEYTTIGCRNVDVDLAGYTQSETLQGLLVELLAGSRDPVVALRGRHRWVESFEPLRLTRPPAESSPFRRGGVYLITGGYGGIGSALGQHLARLAQAKVILVGRTGLPPSDGPMSGGARETLERVEAIESAGGQLLALTADVGDAKQMRSVVRRALERFGTIHGAFHLAGVAPYGLMQLKTAEAASEVMHPKVAGTLVLSNVLRDVPLDFLVMFSSMSSVTGGGPGQVDYCGANAFLDAFARTRSEQHRKCVAVSWGEWEWDAWQEGLWGFPEAARHALIDRRRRDGISFEKGFDALERVLSSGLRHVVVAPRGVRQVVKECDEFSVSAILKRLESARRSQPTCPRPDLCASYVAPATPTEQRIASLWEELLNVEQVGVDDDFFELGGNSLIGLSLVARLRAAFDLRAIPASVIYEAPTVRAMASHLDEARDSAE